MANNKLVKGLDYSNCARAVHDQHFAVMLLEPRPFRPFKTSEEYLYAMKEDLAEWLKTLYGLDIDVDSFMTQLETGVVLCRHANHVLRRARECEANGRNSLNIPIPKKDVVFRVNVSPGTFQARDNVSNFITWCRLLQIHECLLFETDDLVMRKNEKSFILCLLEVARRGSKFGILAPTLVQFEEEIDRELAEEEDEDKGDEKIKKQIITNDLRSLHERVVELLSRCSCPTQYNLEYISDGKYRIGDTKVLIFVRILRSHVMVRVGGGWDTLEHYLDKHDPCRCRSGHRYSNSARLSMTPSKGISNSPQMQVIYNRPNDATTPENFSKRTQYNGRDIQQYSPSSVMNQNEKDFSKSNKSRDGLVFNASNPGSIRSNNSSPNSNLRRNSVDSCSDKNEIKFLHQNNSLNIKSNKSLPKLLPKSVSSDFSHSDSQYNNCTKNNSNLVNNRGKKCSPRKILKTNEEMLNLEKSIGLNRRYSESDESSIASDELIGGTKSDSKQLSRVPRSRYSYNKSNPSSNQTNDAKSRDGLVKYSKSQSSDDVRQIVSTNTMQKSKNSHPFGSTLRDSHNCNQRRSSADSSQSSINGSQRYGSFPRSRSQSSHLRSDESNPQRISQNSSENRTKKLNNLSMSPSGRQVKTWTFKQRSRLPLHHDLYSSNIPNSDSLNNYSDSEINSHNRNIHRNSSIPRKSLDLVCNENNEHLLEKMKNLVQKYDDKYTSHNDWDDFDQPKHYRECPLNKTVINANNKQYVSKIPTLQ